MSLTKIGIIYQKKLIFLEKIKKIFGITNYFVHNTYWGDGTYLDNLGNSYAVSSSNNLSSIKTSEVALANLLKEIKDIETALAEIKILKLPKYDDTELHETIGAITGIKTYPSGITKPENKER